MSYGLQFWISGVLLYAVALAFLVAARVERRAAKYDRDLIDRALTLYANGSKEEAVNALRGMVGMPLRKWTDRRGMSAREFIQSRQKPPPAPGYYSENAAELIRKMKGSL